MCRLHLKVPHWTDGRNACLQFFCRGRTAAASALQLCHLHLKVPHWTDGWNACLQFFCRGRTAAASALQLSQASHSSHDDDVYRRPNIYLLTLAVN